MPLGERPGDKSESRYCGVETEFSDDMPDLLSFNINGGFDFVVAPLMDPAYRPSSRSNDDNQYGALPVAGSDLVLSPSQWSSHVVGKISSWIDLDAEDEVLRNDSETALKQEIAWASHLSLQACLLPTPKGDQCSNYARCVNQILQGLNQMQLWLRIPLRDNDDDDAVDNNASVGKQTDCWETWNSFRLLCEHHCQLSVALDIQSSLPSEISLSRWFGEPVRSAFVHTSSFLTNARGYPCLSKRHQKLVTELFSHSIQIVIVGQPTEGVTVEDPANHTDKDVKSSRLFGFISAGAALGQLFHSMFATRMAWLGSFLLLCAAFLLELAAQSSKGIDRDDSHLSEELFPIKRVELTGFHFSAILYICKIFVKVDYWSGKSA